MTYDELLNFAASLLIYGEYGETCAYCFSFPCSCPAFRYDMNAMQIALEMGY